MQSPVQYPDLFYGNYFRSKPGFEMVVTIKPYYVTSAPELRKLNPSVRLCYYEGERNLSLFGVSENVYLQVVIEQLKLLAQICCDVIKK